ncbi:MAG: hypothetical protein ABL997_10160 [Planctomycetota bacterium]
MHRRSRKGSGGNQDSDVRCAHQFVAEQLRHLDRCYIRLPDGRRFVEALRRLLPPP